MTDIEVIGRYIHGTFLMDDDVQFQHVEGSCKENGNAYSFEGTICPDSHPDLIVSARKVRVTVEVLD